MSNEYENKSKCQSPNNKFGICPPKADWHLTFSLTLELGAASGAPTFRIPHSAIPTMV
jgi:hypothetical protein